MTELFDLKNIDLTIHESLDELDELGRIEYEKYYRKFLLGPFYSKSYYL